MVGAALCAVIGGIFIVLKTLRRGIARESCAENVWLKGCFELDGILL